MEGLTKTNIFRLINTLLENIYMQFVMIRKSRIWGWGSTFPASPFSFEEFSTLSRKL